MNQATIQTSPDPSTMTPGQQVAYYQEQAVLCAAHAAHHAGQAKLHADYVKQLIEFHGLGAPQAPAPSPLYEAPAQQAPPGFHQARAVNVGSQGPMASVATIRFDGAEAASGSGTFAAGNAPVANVTAGNFGTPPADPEPNQGLGFASPPEAQVSQDASAFVPMPAAQQPTHRPPAGAEGGAQKANIKRALGSSLVGVFIGAAIWGGVGFLTGGWEFKYGAILIGFIVGGLALKGAKAPSKSVGIAAGVMSLLSLILGKVLFELLVHPEFSMGEHIAYHTTIIDLIFYGATAATGFVVASTSGAIDKVKARLGRYIPALR